MRWQTDKQTQVHYRHIPLGSDGNDTHNILNISTYQSQQNNARRKYKSGTQEYKLYAQSKPTHGVSWDWKANAYIAHNINKQLIECKMSEHTPHLTHSSIALVWS